MRESVLGMCACGVEVGVVLMWVPQCSVRKSKLGCKMCGSALVLGLEGSVCAMGENQGELV